MAFFALRPSLAETAANCRSPAHLARLGYPSSKAFHFSWSETAWSSLRLIRSVRRQWWATGWSQIKSRFHQSKSSATCSLAFRERRCYLRGKWPRCDHLATDREYFHPARVNSLPGEPIE